MQTSNRKLGIAAFAGLGLLIGTAITPARAADDDGDSLNNMGGGSIASNALSPTALATNPILAGGSALGGLNGVTVEAATLVQSLEY